MITISINFLFIIVGFLAVFSLFYQIPKLAKVNLKSESNFPTFSVIIPARNEEDNLELLLKDLMKQSISPLEIICVDDDSDDKTVEIANSFKVKVICLSEKPDGWLGKSWACHNGAKAAKGELLLFLDADVRLASTALYRLLCTQQKIGSALSIQPYHSTGKNFEQLSLFFNLVQIAANGTASKNQQTIGFYGPLILMSKDDYEKVGGHESIRQNIIEDVALGNRFNQFNIPYRIYVGDNGISFRMYAEGPRSLIEGWIKNQAQGTAMTPPLLFLKVFFWIASLISVPMHLVLAIVKADILWIIVYTLLYFAWIIITFHYSSQIGHFKPWATLFYPIPMLAFLSVYLVSIFRKIFGLQVTWKGRSIIVEDKK